MTQSVHLRLISHHLCPYVQRAVISLTEKNVSFERIDIDLANKPDWFNAISPLGKTPVLQVGDTAIFESAVILEFLEETQPSPLHPSGPLRRAEHRSWVEFGSATLNDIAGFYAAPDAATFAAKTKVLSGKFALLERRLGNSPYFDGQHFSLVDAVFGPVSAISMCSTKSARSAFWRTSRKSQRGARRSPRGHRSRPPLHPTTTRGYGRFLSGENRTYPPLSQPPVTETDNRTASAGDLGAIEDPSWNQSRSYPHCLQKGGCACHDHHPAFSGLGGFIAVFLWSEVLGITDWFINSQ
jgi:glutathione S-transferase